ncbi:MAG: PAS domain S-box protein, partial [Nitrospirae bacterium]|nr:PAS domain S-box protein [Nitrospirota bacterium]
MRVGKKTKGKSYPSGQFLTELEMQNEGLLRPGSVKYQIFFEVSADGILIADIETKMFWYANPAACRMFGYTEEELRAMGVADIHPKADLPRVMVEFEARSRGATTLVPEIPCLRRDGTVFYADVNTVKMTIDGRESNVGFFRDITERKQAENALKARRMELRAILDNLPFLAWLKDREGRFVAVNEPFALACGAASPDELIGKTDLDVWPRHLAECYRTDDIEVMKRGRKKAVEEFVADRGLEKWFETFKAPLFDINGNVIGTTGIARDITGRRLMEEEIRKHRDHLDELVR